MSYRERSPDNFLEEVEEALSFGHDRIHFADDVFTLNGKRMSRLCEGILSRRLDFDWECLVRVASIDSETTEAMKRAGCDMIFFGIESGNDSILRLMNKRTTVEKAHLAFEAASSSGLRTGAFFILGYPGETDDTVLDTTRVCSLFAALIHLALIHCLVLGFSSGSKTELRGIGRDMKAQSRTALLPSKEISRRQRLGSPC